MLTTRGAPSARDAVVILKPPLRASGCVRVGLFFAADLAPWLRRANRRPDAGQALLRSLWNDARCLDAPPYQEGRADALHTFLRCGRRLRQPPRAVPRGASEIGPAGVRAGRARAGGRAPPSRWRRGAWVSPPRTPTGGGVRPSRPPNSQPTPSPHAGAGGGPRWG